MNPLLKGLPQAPQQPNTAMTNQQAIGLMMQQAFQMGTENFVKGIISKNPQAQQIYNSMLQSGNPVEFYYKNMESRGMSREQATQFARQYGIKL